MNIRYTLSLIASCLLLTLFGCSQERNYMADLSQDGDARKVTLTTYAPDADPSLKAELIENAGTLDLQVRFRATDKVSLYVVQNDQITKVGDVAFKELAQDGTKATLDFTLPATVDISKPMTLIGYSGINQKYITLVDNKLEVIADNHTATSKERFNAPVIFRLPDFTVQSSQVADHSVRFEHIGTYEVIHLTNNSAEEVEARYVGLSDASAYSISRSWTYAFGYDSKAKESLAPYYNLVDGSITMKAGYPRAEYTVAPKVAVGKTESVFSWYIPKNVPRPEMVLNIRDKKSSDNVKSQELIPAAATPMEVGKAYHAYGTWDGTKLTLTNSQGEVKPKAFIKVKTEIPAGQTIEVTAYVSYGNRNNAFVDLNGNGIKDGQIENAPTSGWGAVPYLVSQPEITFYGKFETLSLKKQQITSIEISPAALPGELDLTDNKLSTEALNNLFDQLPDVNHIEETIFFTKKLSILGNPGVEDCDAKVAINKGWILDFVKIDKSQSYVHLAMSGYTNNKTLYILLDAADADRDNVWIDLNGDGEMGEGEKIDPAKVDGKKFVEIKWAKDELILYGKLTKLDLSSNGNIQIFLSGNNTTLKYLNLSNNNLAAALLKDATNLEHLDLSGNKLMVQYVPLDVSHLTKLKSLNLANCGVGKVDVSKMNDLIYINVEGNGLTDLPLTGKPNLTTIVATNNELEELKFDSTKVNHIELGGNKLSSEKLNELYNLLPNRTGLTPGAIWITGNEGAGISKMKVALDKNWNVDTKNLKASNKADRHDIEGEDW